MQTHAASLSFSSISVYERYRTAIFIFALMSSVIQVLSHFVYSSLQGEYNSIDPQFCFHLVTTCCLYLGNYMKILVAFGKIMTGIPVGQILGQKTKKGSYGFVL